MNYVRGYKVFNPDWTCRGKKYSCPGIFEEDVQLEICKKGMHFCKNAADCFNYYSFDPENRVAEVIAPADRTDEDGDKCATNYLEIIREITWQEVLEIVNTGEGCTGLRNSGNQNSGDWNSGNYNSGNCNRGDRNSGNWNSGDWNKCSFSSGCFNTIETKIHLFNKPSDWTYKDWRNSNASCILSRIPDDVLEYVWFEDMTDDEKAAHPEAKVTGGYLKKKHKSKEVQRWWNDLPEEEREAVKSLPNFDAEIFKEITGIEVEKDG